MKKRAMRNPMPTLKWGITKDEMPVNATMITTGAETIWAETAASPMTMAPTMPMVWPMGRGRRTPASLSASKVDLHQEHFRKRREGHRFPGRRRC